MEGVTLLYGKLSLFSYLLKVPRRLLPPCLEASSVGASRDDNKTMQLLVDLRVQPLARLFQGAIKSKIGRRLSFVGNAMLPACFSTSQISLTRSGPELEVICAGTLSLSASALTPINQTPIPPHRH